MFQEFKPKFVKSWEEKSWSAVFTVSIYIIKQSNILKICHREGNLLHRLFHAIWCQHGFTTCCVEILFARWEEADERRKDVWFDFRNVSIINYHNIYAGWQAQQSDADENGKLHHDFKLNLICCIGSICWVLQHQFNLLEQLLKHETFNCLVHFNYVELSLCERITTLSVRQRNRVNNKSSMIIKTLVAVWWQNSFSCKPTALLISIR